MNPDTQSVAEIEALIIAKLLQQMKKAYDEHKLKNEEAKMEEMINSAKDKLTPKEQGELKLVLEDPVKFDKAISNVENTYYKELATMYYKENNYLKGYKEVDRNENAVIYRSEKALDVHLSIVVKSDENKVVLVRNEPDMVNERVVPSTTRVHEISFKDLENTFKERLNETQKESNKQPLKLVIEPTNNKEQTNNISGKEREELESREQEELHSTEENKVENKIDENDVLFNGDVKPKYYVNDEPVYDPYEVAENQQNKLSQQIAPKTAWIEPVTVVADEQDKSKNLGLNKHLGVKSTGGRTIRFDDKNALNNREETQEEKKFSEEQKKDLKADEKNENESILETESSQKVNNQNQKGSSEKSVDMEMEIGD